MKDDDNLKKDVPIINIVITVCILAAAVFAVIASVVSLIQQNDINKPYIKSASYDYSYGWINKIGYADRLSPTTINSKTLSVTEPLIYTRKLSDLGNYDTLYMHSRNVVVNVYIDDEPVHITYDSGSIKGLSGFQNFIFVPLSSDSEGSEIRLEIFKTDYSSVLYLDGVVLTYGSEIMKTLLADSIVPIISGALFAMLGIILILFGIFTRSKLESSTSSIYFGIFLIFVSMAVMIDTAWAHVIIDDAAYTEKSFRIFLAVSTPAFMAFIDSFFETEHYYPVKILTIVSCATIPLFFILDTAGIASYDSVGIVWQVLVLLCGITVTEEITAFIVRSKGINLSHKKIDYISIYSFLALGLVDIWLYYARTSGYDDTFCTRLGLLFISAVTAISRFEELINMVKLGVQAGRIGKIAFTDANTGIGNAAAFKAKFDDLESKRSNFKYIGVIQFDVNNLKVINDTKGHEAGDLLIKTAAGIIDQSFGAVGTCYRTGGDEFVALLTGDHAPIVCEEAIYKFNKAIDKFNDDPNKPFDLRIAHGVAYYQNDKTENMTLKDIHKVADERMYSNKKMLKARYARTPEEAVIR